MTLKFFKYALPVSMGLLLCSCVISRSDEEYKNFVKQEVEKIRSEQILLEKQKQENQSEQIALARQKEQLKQEYQVLLQEKEKMKQEKIALSQLKKQLDSEKKQQKVDYEDKSCHSQKDCGDINSGYFCNYGLPYDYGHIHCGSDATPKICEKTNPKSIKIDGKTYYYAEERDVKKWCREATCGASSDAPGNCNWGYLAYEGAISWCHSIGKKLANPTDIASHCLELKKHLPAYQHWVEGKTVVHMESEKCDIQQMVRTDGYANAGSVICE